MSKTFADFIHLANESLYWPEYRYQRTGQRLFNVLHYVNQTLAESLADTPVDPFYDDTAIPDFLAATELFWENPDRDEIHSLVGKPLGLA